MPEVVIKLNPQSDQLNDLEQQVRTIGKWCDNGGMAKVSHFFVAKNAAINTAVSLCFTEVTTFSRLRAPIAGRRCLVCELYENSRKEVRDKAIDTVTDLQADLQTQSNDKEKENKK